VEWTPVRHGERREAAAPRPSQEQGERQGASQDARPERGAGPAQEVRTSDLCCVCFAVILVFTASLLCCLIPVCCLSAHSDILVHRYVNLQSPDATLRMLPL
jgi:hypothetical protein